MPTRTRPSTTQNPQPVPSQPRNRPVSNSGARKNRPMAKARATKSVTPISFLPSGSSSSPSDSLADIVRARSPITSDSTSATTPRTTGVLRMGQRFIQLTRGNSWTPMVSSGRRTASDQWSTPRIMTPSMTAWPPTWARRAHRAARITTASALRVRRVIMAERERRPRGRRSIARGSRPVDVFGLVRLAASHLALRACAVEAAGATALEEVGRQFFDHAAHLPGERPDLPLRAIAAAHLEEVAQLARVHRDDDLGLGSVGEHEARVFLHALAGPALGEAQLDQPVVGHAGLLHGLEKHRLGLGVGGHGGRDDETVAGPEVHVPLRLLVVAGHAVTHQLVREGARDPVDGEAEGGVLEGGVVTGPHEDAHELGDVLVAHLLLEVGGRHGRIAKPPRDRDGAVGVGRVLEECDAQLGVHRRTPVRPCWLQPWRARPWRVRPWRVRPWRVRPWRVRPWRPRPWRPRPSCRSGA